MSVVEQWGTFSGQHTNTRANLNEREETYKGFNLRASTKAIGNGFSMSVCITCSNAGSVKEVLQTPAWSITKFSTAEEALTALIIYGQAIVDRAVPGVDVSVLLG